MKNPQAYRPALIIIDMINDFNFHHGRILADKALNIAKPINALKTAFYEQDLPVIYVNDHYNLWQADLDTITNHGRNPISAPILHEMHPSPG